MRSRKLPSDQPFIDSFFRVFGVRTASCRFAAAVFLLLVPSLALGGECLDRQELLALVDQLGDQRFPLRESATRDLLAAGHGAVGALQQAADGEDLEVTARAVAILQQLHFEADRDTALLAGHALRSLTASTRPAIAHRAAQALRYRHRQALRQIVEFGGDVRVESEPFGSASSINDWQTREALANAVNAAKPQDFGLRATISDKWRGGDEGLANLASIENLRAVSLRRAPISVEAVAYLQSLTEVEGLSCEETAIGDEQLEVIANMPHLKKLFLGDSRVTGAGLARLASLKELEYLSLKSLPVNDQDLAALAKLEKLNQLGLDETGVSSAGLAQLAHIPRLQTLWLNKAKVTDEGLAALAGLGELRTLYLVETPVQGAGFASLAGKVKLTSLSCSNAPINDAGLEQIAKMDSLESLGLDGTKITNDGLRHLAGMKNLQSLWLRDTQISDEGLKHLASLTNLGTLYVARTSVTGDGVEELRELLPNLVVRR